MDVGLLDGSELRDLLIKGLWSDRGEAFAYFKKQLLKISEDELRKRHPQFDELQLNYVAGVLTAFSMRSIDMGNWPVAPPQSKELQCLEQTYNVPSLPLSPWRCEKLGRLLLFAGSFEEERVRNCYSEYWIVLVGERLFLQAAVEPRINLLLGISRNFALWLNYLRALKYKLIRGNQVFKPSIVIPKNPV